MAHKYVAATLSGTTIGALGARGIATIDAHGVLTLCDRGIDVEWMVGGESWRVVATDSTTRQTITPGAPVAVTRIAGAGGDIVQTTYGVGGTPNQIVCEFENAGREAVSLAVLLRAAPGARLKKFDAQNPVLSIDGLEVMSANRPWQQWALAQDELTLRTAVASHATSGGSLSSTKMKGQRNGCVALVWPLAHHSTLRVVFPLAPGPQSRVNTMAIDGLPTAAAVTSGWETQLERGTRVEIDDAQMQAAIDGARASVILQAFADTPKPDADLAVALEDWGLEPEAVEAWKRLSIRDRRHAGQREPSSVDGWIRVKSHLSAPRTGVPSQSARFLQAVRDTLLNEQGNEIDLFPGFPSEWLGRSVAVHNAVSNSGPVSFALRWHGGRPALLWDAPAATTLRASRLDPTWHVVADGPGEQLLNEPAAELLAMQPAPRVGTTIDEPGSFL